MGNIDARRDWGYAPDFVRMMWKMLQQEEPGDYVVATGETHSVREFIEKSFAHVGRRIEWRGSGAEEIGVDTTTGRTVVRIDPRYFRPAVTFEELVRIMTEGDLRLLDRPGYETGF